MSIPYSRYIFGRLPWYGALITCGVILALLLACREEKRLRLKQDTMIDLAFWVLPFGVIGARLYYAAFNWSVFTDDPLSILRIWEGGLAIYGGVIGGLTAIMLFARRRKLHPLLLTDAIAPGVVLAQSIGRWGNYFNMEAFGREITNPALQFFPIGVQIPAGTGYTWHMATFFYESMWNLFVFLLLWFAVRKRSPKPGITTLCYLMLYGFGRFFIEGLRTDSLMLGPVRISQLLSLLLVVISAATLLVGHFKRKHA